MYEVSIQSSFAAAHRLENYKGQCEELHGHNWKVQVTVARAELNEIGLAVDFTDLKQWTGEILRQLDHRLLNDVEPFTSCNPSSENIARHIYTRLQHRCAGSGVRVVRVQVWESDSAWATYYE